MTDFLQALNDQKVEEVFADVLIPNDAVCESRDIPESMRISVKVKSLSPRAMEGITKRATERKIDRSKNRQEVDVSEERLSLEIAKSAVLDWKVTIAQWRYWAPSNPQAFSNLDVQPNDLIPFSPQMCAELSRRALSLNLAASIIEAATRPGNFAPDEITFEDEVKN